MRASMRPAWCYLIVIRATDTVDMRARAARVASWDRNVEHVFVAYESARARGIEQMKIVG